MKTSALRKRHKRKTKRITKRLIRLDEKKGGKKRIARNEKRKKEMQKKGTWSSKAEKGAKKKIIRRAERELMTEEHQLSWKQYEGNVKKLKKVKALKDKIKAIKKGEILFEERERKRKHKEKRIRQAALMNPRKK